MHLKIDLVTIVCALGICALGICATVSGTKAPQPPKESKAVGMSGTMANGAARARAVSNPDRDAYIRRTPHRP
jgi:hypothetical protein